MSLWDEHKKERRMKILDSARRIIIEGGVEELSMRRLANEARLSVATLYNLFGSKHDILRALQQGTYDRWSDKIDDLEQSDPINRIYSILDLAFSPYLEDKDFYRPLLREIHRLTEAAKADPVVSTKFKDLINGELETLENKKVILNGSTGRLTARQIYINLNTLINLWATEFVEDEKLPAYGRYAVTICLSAVATEKTRPEFLKRLREYEDELGEFIALG